MLARAAPPLRGICPSAIARLIAAMFMRSRGIVGRLDLGANTGLFILRAAQCARGLDVYAYEPAPPERCGDGVESAIQPRSLSANSYPPGSGRGLGAHGPVLF